MSRNDRGRLVRAAILAAVGACLGGISGVGYSMTQLPRVYAAHATLVFPLPGGTGTMNRATAALFGDQVVPMGSEIPLVTYQAVLKSRRAAEGVARRLEVQKRFDLPSEKDAVEFVDRCVDAGINLDRTVDVSATVEGTPSVMGMADLLDRAGANKRDTSYRRFVAEVIVAVVQEMGVIADEMKLDRSKANVDTIRERLSKEKRKLQDMQDDLVRLQSTVGNLDVETYADGLTSALLSAKQTKREIDAELAGARVARDKLGGELRRQVETVEDLPTEFPFLTRARARYRAAVEQHERLAQMYGPENAAVVKARAELDQARRALDRELSSSQAGMQPDLLDAERQVLMLEAQHNVVEETIRLLGRELGKLPSDLSNWATLKQEMLTQVDVVSRMETEFVQAEMEYERRGVHWTILDEPEVPTSKIAPRNMLSLLVGVFLGTVAFGIPLFSKLLAVMFAVPEPTDEEEASLAEDRPSPTDADAADLGEF